MRMSLSNRQWSRVIAYVSQFTREELAKKHPNTLGYALSHVADGDYPTALGRVQRCCSEILVEAVKYAKKPEQVTE